MIADILIFVSKRSQRCAAAVLMIVVMHLVMAVCTSEPAGPMTAQVDLSL